MVSKRASSKWIPALLLCGTVMSAAARAPENPRDGAGVIVDYFAGGGGASTGLELAYGRPIDLAVNHDPEAIEQHMANHPLTEHALADVFEFDIVKWLAGRNWLCWWASPDCTHHSRAKGGKPVSNKRRALADVVVETVEKLPAWQRPRVIHLENVPEFREWGPLGPDGRPDKSRKGEFYIDWCRRLAACGYVIYDQDDVCADRGSPTTRKRFILTARCDGLPIVVPAREFFNPKRKRKPGESRAGMKPWRTAASHVIDFSIPGKSIFGRKKPLAEATMTRVARGVKRFVIDSPKPFVVPLTHHGKRREHAMDEPLPTITCAHNGELALVEPRIAPHVTKFRANSIGHAVDEPMHTVTANSFEVRPGGAAPIGVVDAHLAPFVSSFYGEGEGGNTRGAVVDEPVRTVTCDPRHAIVSAFVSRVDMASAAGRNGIADADEPLRAITTSGPFALASAHMLRLQGSARRDREADEPLGAVMASGQHHAHVAAFMAQHNIDNVGHAMGEPVSTIVTKGCTQGVVECDLSAEAIEEGCERVLAFMLKYYGTEANGEPVDEPLDTVTTKDRFALITVHIGGVPYRIFDIRIRMLSPRELYNAQGFPADYIIDPWITWVPPRRKADIRAGRVRTIAKRMSKSSSIAKCGNSVPPHLSYAWAKANAPPMTRLEGKPRWADRRVA
jgi:DNA (cytosine-5)-methyltransferase 1